MAAQFPDVSHSLITDVCRANRGDDGAWDEAVARAKQQYDDIVAGWRDADQQPVLHLRLQIERPDRDIRTTRLRSSTVVVVKADDVAMALRYGDWNKYMGSDVKGELVAALDRLGKALEA